MTSVDAGSIPLRASSDEVYDHLCESCSDDGVEKEAKHYCQDCRQKICNTCKDQHRKLAVTRNHAIVPINKISTAGSGNQAVIILCGCNKNQHVSFYCETHRELICSPCQSFQHHSCTTSTIKEKSSGYKQATFDALLSKTKSLNNRYEQLKKEAEGIDSECKNLKDACKKEIQTFRKELNAFLDNLEKNMDAELDQWEMDELRRVKQHVADLTTALGLLQTDLKLLEDVKRDGRKEIMYTADVKVSKTIQGYERRLRELENAGGRPTLTFERNKLLDDLKSTVKSLGSLTSRQIHISCDTAATKASNREKAVLLGRKVQSNSPVNVKTGDDKQTPWITGCTVMTSGNIILCDTNNDKIKLLNSSGSLTENMPLSSNPWDVSVLDPTSVIVTLPNKRQLQVVQICPYMTKSLTNFFFRNEYMKSGKLIQLDKKCWGVEVAKKEIYVTCHTNPGQGEVRVLGLDGEVKRRLGVHQDGSFMFTSPYYITVNQSGEKIFVSDWTTDTVTCMSVDGRVIYTYKDDSLGEPAGLLCDSEDNILVCGRYSNNVQVLTADGRRHNTLLTVSDRIDRPYSIVYRDSDNTLLVSCYNMDKLLSFELAE